MQASYNPQGSKDVGCNHCAPGWFGYPNCKKCPATGRHDTADIYRFNPQECECAAGYRVRNMGVCLRDSGDQADVDAHAQVFPRTEYGDLGEG